MCFAEIFCSCSLLLSFFCTCSFLFLLILVFFWNYFLYIFGLLKRILDFVLEYLDVVFPIHMPVLFACPACQKEHTNKSGPEPSTGNRQRLKSVLQYLLAGVVFNCVHFVQYCGRLCKK